MRKLLMIIFTTAAMGAAAQEQPTQAESDLQYAEYLVNNDRRAQAYTQLNAIIKDHRQCAKAYYLRSEAYLADGNTKSASQDIDMALGIEPHSARYQMQKALTLSATGKYNLAAQYVAKALAAQPDILSGNDEMSLSAAEILIKDGNTIDALPMINAVKDRKAKFYRVRGIAYAQSGMNDYAIEDLSHALDLDPKLSDCYIYRGLARYQNGDKDAARADWQTAIQKRQYAAREYLNKYN